MARVFLTPGYYADPATDKAIASGYIYVGEPDKAPQDFPVTVTALQEDGNAVAIAQPIRTGVGGAPMYNGATVSLFVEADYSLQVLRSDLTQAYLVPRTSQDVADPNFSFPVWDNGVTYSQNDYVTGSDNKLYSSIAGANLGNDPTSTTGFWGGSVDSVGDQGDVIYYNADGKSTRIAAGDEGQILSTGGAGANPSWTRPDHPVATFTHQTAQGVDGGSATAGAYETRTINTEEINEIPGASLAGNVITLPVGRYEVAWSCALYSTDDTATKFINTTKGNTYKGLVVFASGTANTGCTSSGAAKIGISETNDFELQTYPGSSQAVNGYGYSAVAGAGVNVYVVITITQVEK